MEKIKTVAKYIGLSLLSKDMTVSPLKLQKLLYYVQAWYMVFFDRRLIFDDIPEAWVNGPVYPRVFHEYKDKAANMCDHLSLSAFDKEATNPIDAFRAVSEAAGFSTPERDLLERVVLLYGAKSQNELIFLSHSEDPWVEARGSLAPFERSNNKISHDTMWAYYKERYDRNRKRK